MSEASPDLHVGPAPDQASVEVAAPVVEPAAEPAVDERAQASPAQPEPAAPAPAVDPLQELEDVRQRMEALVAENQHLKEQLALHAASSAVDAAAALKQIAALAAPFA